MNNQLFGLGDVFELTRPVELVVCEVKRPDKGQKRGAYFQLKIKGTNSTIHISIRGFRRLLDDGLLKQKDLQEGD